MTAASAELRAVIAVAEAASEPLPSPDRAHGVLRALREVVPYDCAELSSFDPVQGGHTTLASVDYDPPVLAHFSTKTFVDELDDLDMRRTGSPMRMRDLPREALAARTVNEVLIPAGFRDGLTICLRLPDGRHAGLLNLSTTGRDHPDDQAREAITLLGGTLANVVDPVRSLRILASTLEPGSSAIALRDGEATPLDGFVAGPVLCHEHPALAAAQRFARSGRPQHFLALGGDDRAWFRVHLYRCELDDAWVVASQPTTPPYELTRREIEVLTLLAAGRSNPEIAQALVVSPRTISSHVEHILAKLDVPARAAAAARAVGEGLLLPIP